MTDTSSPSDTGDRADQPISDDASPAGNQPVGAEVGMTDEANTFEPEEDPEGSAH